eukprot:CAMPEP_0184979662 /NCGR_PEP_ID=MMETSP1098-20130426/9857_1 /TAXON_ID=89044 /ORGANISM="Spumella elongata, Strain CCAP 955/1" /LENGTH=572 /DNA_ID=CAMNT_0027502991 /DNA_START=34 /DNA_END=1753 /DNA_ORIENTATION=-
MSFGFVLRYSQARIGAQAVAYRSLRSISSASAKFEEEVTTRIKDITDPATDKSIASIGILQGIKVKDNAIRVALDFFVPGYPYQKQIETAIRKNLEDVTWSKGLTIQVEEPKKFANLNTVAISQTTLTNVGHIIGVSSCKGGVGKSTVAANLAISLSRMGLRVGLLDADVYGPSLPILLPELSPVVQRSPTNPKNVLPLRAAHCPDLKMLSFGHVNPKSGAPGSGGKAAAVVRGPIATRILNQLLLATEWGDLDYLVVDMPPGTGDIQLTLSQSACISGAVIVTTPHTLSLVDAAKGVAMFEELKVPTLAVVENMSYFVGDDGKRYFPLAEEAGKTFSEAAVFCKAIAVAAAVRLCQQQQQDHRVDVAGPTHRTSIRTLVGTAAIGTAAAATAGKVEVVNESFQRLQDCPLHVLPIYTRDSDRDEASQSQSTATSDSTLPICITEPESEPAAVYSALARDVVLEVYKNQVSALLVPSVSYSKHRGVLLLRYFTASQAVEYAIPAQELRMRDPMTGKTRSLPSSAVEDAYPTAFDLKGHYGVSIVWSDGHFADIYPYDVLRDIALEVVQRKVN